MTDDRATIQAALERAEKIDIDGYAGDYVAESIRTDIPELVEQLRTDKPT